MNKSKRIISIILLMSMLSGCEILNEFLSSPTNQSNNISSTKVESSVISTSTIIDNTVNSNNSTNNDIINSSSSNNNDSPISSSSEKDDEKPNSSSNTSSSTSSSTIIYEEVLDVTGFTFVEKVDGYYVNGFDNNLKSICKIPTKYNDKAVIGIEKNAFKNNETIKELVIPYSIQVIEESAFEKCNSLEKITLNAHVNLKAKAFYKCFALKEINTEKGGFTNIGEYAFYNCGNLVTIDFSTSIKLEKIDSYAFYNCVKLKNTSMPSSLKEIGVRAFYHCVLFKSLSFKNDSELTTIREAAFENCTTLETVYLPYKLETLEKNPFGYCQKLMKFTTLGGPNGETGKYMSFNKNGSYTLLERNTYDLVINPSGKSSLDGVKVSLNTTKVKPYAFRGCNHLANIELPETIEEIGENAFFGVEGAMTINIPKSNSYYSYDANGFYNYNKTEYISFTNFGSTTKTECEIAASVEIIKDYAFFNAKYLTKLTLKNKDTIISKNALAGSKINEIYIEETNETYTVSDYIYNYQDDTSINNYLNEESTYLDLSNEDNTFTTVGDYAFSNKYKLEYVIFNEKVNTFGDSVFFGTNANLEIYLNINKEDLNENTSPYWNDGREVYYKGEWKLVDNVPTPIN